MNNGTRIPCSRGIGLLVAISIVTASPTAADETQIPITAPPPESGFDDFYLRYISVDGFPVISSERVHDAALREAAWVIRQMLATRPDIREALIESGTRCTIMAVDELTTAIPEHSDLTPARYWDRRARGLGATPRRPCVSCGEENLLRFPGDPYATESILVHEFAHAIHDMGLTRIDEQFDPQLQAVYEEAMSEGLWRDKYAATNRHDTGPRVYSPTLTRIALPTMTTTMSTRGRNWPSTTRACSSSLTRHFSRTTGVTRRRVSGKRRDGGI